MGTALSTHEVNRSLAEIGKRIDKAADRIYEGIPSHISPARMKTGFLMALRDNTDLVSCSATSLFACMKESATLGLEVGGPLPKAYLVPFKDTKKGTVEAQFIIGYRGLIDMMRRSGEVSQIDFEVVRDGDRFKNLKGDAAGIYHEPSDDPQRDSRPITHCYVIVKLVTGVQRLVWTSEQVNHHKEIHSKGWKRSDSPWQTHWEAMAFKTMIRFMCNRGLVPLSADVISALDREDRTLAAQATVVKSAAAGDAVFDEDGPGAAPELLGAPDDASEPEPPGEPDRLPEATFVAIQEAIEECTAVSQITRLLAEHDIDTWHPDDADAISKVVAKVKKRIRE